MCARVCVCVSERARERGSERAGARECACLTRGEVCKGRIPSFLPQPLVETRRMQRPPGRSAAPRRRRPWGRDPAAPGAPAHPPLPPARVAPLPRREGPASPVPGAAQSQETPGVGGAAPLLPSAPDLRERSALRRGTVSLPAWQLPRGPASRPDPSPSPDFPASRVPHFPPTPMGDGLQRRGGAGEGGGHASPGAALADRPERPLHTATSFRCNHCDLKWTEAGGPVPREVLGQLSQEEN